MTDDHIKRFRLSEAQPHRSFAQAAQDRSQIRDKDNAQPIIPPPRTVFLPHPRLAPPGMMGSRPTFKPLAPKSSEPGQFKADDLYFKPLVRTPDKSRRHNR